MLHQSLNLCSSGINANCISEDRTREPFREEVHIPGSVCALQSVGSFNTSVIYNYSMQLWGLHALMHVYFPYSDIRL